MPPKKNKGKANDWAWAIDCLNQETRHYKYMYFALTKPPNEEDGDSIQDSANYKLVQDKIKNSIQYLYDEINDFRGGNNNVNRIKKELEKQMEKQKKKEEILFNKIFSNAKAKNPQYNTLYNQTDINSTHFDLSGIKQIQNMTTVEFWTALFYDRLTLKSGQTKQKSTWDGKDCFALIISSDEMYYALKSNFATEIFTRTQALRGTQYENTVDNMGGNITTEVLQAFYDKFINNAQQYINTNAGPALQQAVETLLSKYITFTQKGNGIKIIGKQKLKKVVSATTFSQNLRDSIREVLDKYQIDKYELTNTEANGKQGTTILRVYSPNYRAKGFNLLYKDQQGKTLVKNDYIIATFDTLYNIIKNNISKNCQTLTIGGLGTLDLNKYYKNNINKFYTLALNYCSNQQQYISDIIKSAYDKEAYKPFKAANSNAYVSGILGELSAAFKISSGLKEEVKMTGNVYSGIQGFTYGQSVNDLRGKFKYKDTTTNKIVTQSYGVNVKNYVVSAENQITLYDGGKALSVFSPYMNKYLTKKESNVLRFCATNAGFFDKPNSQIRTIVNTIAAIHTPEFLRIYDHSAGKTIVNYFYQINQVIYPASYIYKCILNRLDQIIQETRRNGNIPFFTISLSGMSKNNVFKYPNLKEARQKWFENDFKLNDNFKNKRGDIQIKSNGLKMNLVSLSLF